MHATTRELIALRDGEPLAATTAAHVRGCHHCQAELASLKDTAQALRDLPGLAPPAQAWARILEAAERPKSSWRPLPLALAASLAGLLSISLVLGLWLDGTGPDTGPTESTPLQLQEAGLWAESLELERLRGMIHAAPLPMSLATVSTVSDLEREIDRVDQQLAGIEQPEQRLALWQERLELLEAAVILEASESNALYFAHTAIF